MASVTLKISAFDQGSAGYPVELIEDGATRHKGVLPAADFVSGAWRVNIRNGVQPAPADPAAPPRDIVSTVIGTDGAKRAAADWTGLPQKLFELLFPVGPLRNAFNTFGDDTRLFLDIEPEELQRVPWELARWDGPPLRLLSISYSLSRLHAAQHPAGNTDWPFRVLILVGCKKTEEEKLGVAAEIQAIRRAFVPFGRSIDVREVYTPSPEKLSTLIKGEDDLQKDSTEERWEPHVLHFVGHTAPSLTGAPALKFDRTEIKDGVSWTWSSEDIQLQLPKLKWTPQFVFLNACRTGAEEVHSWGMQRSFISAGAQCVLTMQADVLGSLVGKFAGKLYEQIAMGKSVQEATYEARDLVHKSPENAGRIDWALPSLTGNATEIRLFAAREPPDDAEFKNCAEFGEARLFANSEDARRLLTHWLCPIRLPAAPPRPRNVVLLTGESLCGKSHLLKWAMESWVMSGARVCYIELDNKKKKGYLDILRQIRRGDMPDSDQLLRRGLPQAHFERYLWTVGNLRKNGLAGDWEEADKTALQISDLADDGPIQAKSEDRFERVLCAEFLAALKEVAKDKPLVLVFDKFTGPDALRLVSPEDFAYLVTDLFGPIAKDAASRIKLVFSANSNERGAYRLNEIANFLTITVPDKVETEDLVRYAVEMLRFQDEDKIKVTAANLLSYDYDEKGMARLAIIRRAMPPHLLAKVKRMR